MFKAVGCMITRWMRLMRFWSSTPSPEIGSWWTGWSRRGWTTLSLFSITAKWFSSVTEELVVDEATWESERVREWWIQLGLIEYKYCIHWLCQIGYFTLGFSFYRLWTRTFFILKFSITIKLINSLEVPWIRQFLSKQ